jgi:protein gp37
MTITLDTRRDRKRAGRSRTTKIEWADYAHALGYGCTKVSRGCDNCYAESWTHRFKKAGWGPHAERIPAKASTLRRPIAWNRKAERDGKPAFVFCFHASDVFDNQAPDEWRADFGEGVGLLEKRVGMHPA